MAKKPNKGGRPPMWKTAASMQKAVDEYFAKCEAGEKHVTIMGLALALGFNSRQSLLNYEGKPEFVDTIKTAKARVEEYLEQSLYNGAVAGPIFNLKNNFGWKDKTEQEITGKDGKPLFLWDSDANKT